MATFEEKGDNLYINGKKVLKGWESFTGWYWFATEKVEDEIYCKENRRQDSIHFHKDCKPEEE